MGLKLIWLSLSDILLPIESSLSFHHRKLVNLFREESMSSVIGMFLFSRHVELCRGKASLGAAVARLSASFCKIGGWLRGIVKIHILL